MKALQLMLLLLVGASQALVAQDLDIRVSAEYDQTTLAQVLDDLAEQHGLLFSYSKDLIQLDKPVVMSVWNAPLRRVLDLIFAQAGVEYEVIGDQIVLKSRDGTNPLTISGKVVDKETNTPLPFASVLLKGTSIGTATNSDGLFILNVPGVHRTGEITVSFVGYKPQRIAIPDLKDEIAVGLESDPMTLDAVVVTATTGLSILEEAIGRIHENYDTNAVAYTFFVRDRLLQDDEPIAAGEIEYAAYRRSLASDESNQISVTKGRRVKDYKATQEILQTFPRWTGFEIGIDNGIIFSSDPVASGDRNRFPGKGFLEMHDFELLGIGSLDGEEVYVVSFDQKAAYKNRSLYAGKLYIDSETLAFRRIEMGLSETGIANAKFFGTSRAAALLFGYSRCTVSEERTILNYKPLNGKWYLNSAEVVWAANLVKPKCDFASEVTLTGELIVTSIRTQDARTFYASDTLNSVEGRGWYHKYAPEFWNGHNAIPTDKATQAMVNEIKEKNRENGIDMKFWRRYQPYRANPSWLTVDSVLAAQDPGIHAGAPLYVQPGKLSSPKYPPLSVTFNTGHFVMHYVPGDSSSARELAAVLKKHYSRVLQLFDLKVLPGAIHAEIYPDIENYHFAIGNPEAGASDVGMAVSEDRFKIVSPSHPGSYHTRASMLKAALHEFAHCVHYQFMVQLTETEKAEIDNADEAPWLFEAMASYAAGQFYEPDRFEYLKKGNYPTVDELNDIEGGGKVYDIGYVLIEFILKQWGHEGLVQLLKTNGQIRSALGVSVQEFQGTFHQYLKDTYLGSTGPR